MKHLKAVLAILSIFLLTSCDDYIQVVFTNSDSKEVKEQQGFYVYENDDVKVAYSFWAQRGIMSFMFYNKSDRPIYIDWKKSAFINERERIPYYSQKTTTNFDIHERGYSSSYAWTNIFDAMITGTGSTYSNKRISGTGTVVKEERVTFIPPRSYVFKGFGNIVGHIYFDPNERNTVETEIGGRRVYETRPTKTISFRNFVTYSHSEGFEQESYIDNSFYVSKVVSMKESYFAERDENGETYYPYKKPTRFYLSEMKEDDLFGHVFYQ